jgi:hypothetical protein
VTSEVVVSIVTLEEEAASWVCEGQGPTIGNETVQKNMGCNVLVGNFPPLHENIEK